MAWNEFGDMSRRERHNLLRKAISGNDAALRKYLSFSREIKKEANYRLARLERAGLDYGPTYNNLMYFLQVENDSNRLKSARQLNYDLYDLHTQNEMALKFLKTQSSIVKKARASERARIQTLKEKEILPQSFTRSKNVDFLRFLGNEEVSATMDEYGSSEVIVEMLYDAYMERGSGIFRIASQALTEFLAGRTTFDVAMERIGIKVEDYYSGRPTS